MKSNIVYEDHKPVSATVLHRGRPYVATPEHPNFPEIIHAIESKRPVREVIGLFDTASVIAKGFRAVRRLLGTTTQEDEAVLNAASAVKVRNGRLYYGAEEMHGVLADTIVAYHREGRKDFFPLVRFVAKVMENPNEHSREQLYDWMKHLSFTIHDDGDILGYKSVNNYDGKLTSVSSGAGIVNGKKVNGKLDNSVGNIIEMPREKVQWDPRVSCHTGLHVGTIEYAEEFSGNQLIEVKVNPKDVVSVPSDCNGQKMRVCRYEVVRTVTRTLARTMARRSRAAV